MVTADDALKLSQDLTMTDFMWGWDNLIVASLRCQLYLALLYISLSFLVFPTIIGLIVDIFNGLEELMCNPNLCVRDKLNMFQTPQVEPVLY